MSDNPSKNSNPTEEIDLGQLFTIIGKWFNRLFVNFIVFFVYLKKNIFWLGGLVILGGLCGYLLNQFTDESQQLDVIVTPNLETKNYLYDVVAEIQAEINAQDTIFLQTMGVELASVKELELEINPLRSQSSESLKADDKILDLLKDFDSSEAITDILREELKDKAVKEHRLSFYFKDPFGGKETAQKIVSYINSNPYYNQLIATYRMNAEERIIRNDSLIVQIDRIIKNYTDRMGRDQLSAEGRLVLDNQEPLDVPSLLEFKNRLIRDSEAKKLDLEMKKNAITIVSFGNPYIVQKPIFQKNIILFPLIFLGAFFLLAFIRYLNRKSKEMQIG